MTDSHPSHKAERKSVWVSTDVNGVREMEMKESHDYAPLTETVRLYAGWLLAWYFVIYAFGEFQVTRHLAWTSPALQSLFLSPVIANLSCAVFLFLLLSGLHKFMGRGVLRGLAFAGFGAIMLLLFATNT